MPSSTNTKKPQDRKPKAGAKKYGAGWKVNLHDLELPSGELCQVKRPGVEGLVKAGVLQSMDSLTAIVQGETIPKAQGKPVANVQDLVSDPEKLSEMMKMADRIVCAVVVQPPVRPSFVTQSDIDSAPRKWSQKDLDKEIPYEDREEGVVYTDYISDEDKMFIMNFAVGGSADLQRFREESEALVGGVLPGVADGDPSE